MSIVVWASYFIANIIVTYAFRSFPDNGVVQSYLVIFTAGLWSLAAIHLYGIQQLENYSYYQNIYITFVLVQLCGVLFCSIKWLSSRIRTVCVFLVFLILGGGLIYWLFNCVVEQAFPYLM
ncbi:hypothetical protein NSQ26_13170 [Bacillus sp. FSL W7-1360]